MLHPVPAVPRAVSLRSRLPRRWPAFVLLPLVALAWPVPVAHAVDINVLSNPSVAPGSGTTGTSFTFSVHYASTQGQVAQRVVALSSGWSVELILSAGTSTDGTYIGARTLPAGSWPVEFRAVSQGKDPLPISGPTVTVVGPPTPTPVATPLPTPAPTSVPPTVAPTPTPDRTASPAGTPTARPTATPRRNASPRPSSAASSTVAPATSAIGAPASPAPTASGAVSPVQTDGTPSVAATGASRTPGPSAPPAAEAASAGSLRGPLLVIGGGLTVTGALVLGVQYARVRHRRRGLP
ncbi:MAG TPA: hypothetical protein VFQ81_12260 [Candidatus Limnocylindria bacterium]|nr:hypothetical protein [Candidatus Limnocylindria bacterium]